jgi:argininosuccinate lyase
MTKLWQVPTTKVNPEIERFTIGNDNQFDLQLAQWDVIGTMAHCTMLHSIGLITTDEKEELLSCLKNIYDEIQEGTFEIGEGMEDVHSQIESLLTRSVGEAGKKIHSGRSRNDQVLLDIKLYLRHEIREIALSTKKLFEQFQFLSNTHRDKLLPGYTHLQLAMPSSFGLWFGAYAESLSDDMDVLLSAYKIVNKNPLGSGAGYGSSFPLDRNLTTKLLGFGTLNYNSVYAQMTRGKTEKIVASALATIAATLSRFSMDTCLYLNQNFDFISFPNELTTGSSIMPHKKNPDVFELIRGKCNRIQALPNELTLLCSNLPSGYHREMQLTKEILFPAISSLKECLAICHYMLKQIQVKDHLLEDRKYDHLFSVESVNRDVLSGTPFREAYRKTAQHIKEKTFSPVKELKHSHEGSIGNLCNEEIQSQMNKTLEQFGFEKTEMALKDLLEGVLA